VQTASRMTAFFGPDASEVLALYRWLRLAKETLRPLDAELAKLNSRKTNLAEQNETEIAQQRGVIAAADEKLAGLRKTRSVLQAKRAGKARRVASFWGRLEIRIKRTFSRRTTGVKDTLRMLKELDREIDRAEDQIDETLEILNLHRRSLQRLTDPIADLDYAIGFIQEKRETVSRDSESLHFEIDNRIRTTAKNTLPAVLQQKLCCLPKDCDAGHWATKILELKDAVTKIDAFRTVRPIEETATDEDLDAAIKRVGAKVRDGIYVGASHGTGDVNVSGRGTKHVRKTRTVTRTDSEGRARFHTETYWDSVRVSFSGLVRASFEVECCRWQNATTGDALREEMQRWVRVGRNRAGAGWLDPLVEELQQRATQLIGEIREELQRDLGPAQN